MTTLDTKYLISELVEDKGKTQVYAIYTKKEVIESGIIPHRIRLGTVAWLGRWRQYCFFPYSDMVFNKACLNDIIDFISKLMQERRK